MKIPSFKFAGLKTKPKILIGICSPLVLLMGLGAASVYSIDTIVDTNKQVDHTHVVLGEAAAIVSSAVDMETGMRGYLLAGQDGFLDPYLRPSWTKPTRGRRSRPLRNPRSGGAQGGGSPLSEPVAP